MPLAGQQDAEYARRNLTLAALEETDSPGAHCTVVKGTSLAIGLVAARVQPGPSVAGLLRCCSLMIAAHMVGLFDGSRKDGRSRESRRSVAFEVALVGNCLRPAISVVKVDCTKNSHYY